MTAFISQHVRQHEKHFLPRGDNAARVFLPFAGGYFLSYLFRTVNGPIADKLTAEFHLDAGNLGLLTSVYFLFFTIAQLPYGPLIDRFGPRRVQAVVLTIGVFGAVLFAAAQNVTTLIVARALIGLGTSGALMAGLKALASGISEERRPLANGCFIMFGGLGAMVSTVPVDLLLPVFGWRGVFLLLATATLAIIVLILVLVPEPQPTARPTDWRSNFAGLLDIYRTPVFWRLAPLSATVIGTAFAVHGLWAARWLADVDHLAPDRVALELLIMGAGLTLGAGVIGLITDRLRRRGVRPMVTFGFSCSLFIGLQLASLARMPLPAWLIWGAIASFGSMTVLSYSIIGELFPAERIGRANGALNVLHLGMAFILQYAIGLIVSLWHPDTLGHLPLTAYRAAFALPLFLELLALGWFVSSVMLRRRDDAAFWPREVS